ncbi:hypothetical protein [uncultured Algimonas sp.]|uniref:hypothetical protein n=1 Tax=uncultured Algimonas sp. TaxID=1547920 RepID=UPI00262ABB4F|nr:hypothetical protein [uncultured Algimonas sp.]
MTTRQDMKADARKSANKAPKADPKTAAKAVKDAKAAAGRQPEQPIYKTQTEDIAGDNVHHDKDKVISEFDDPANNKVR